MLAGLKEVSGQKWLDGALSIQDCRFNEGKDQFPLYALQLWLEFDKQANVQKRWQASLSWATEQMLQVDAPSSMELFRESQELLAILPWNAPVKSRSAHCTTADFTELLGFEWLSSDVLDLALDAMAQNHGIRHSTD